MTSSAKKKSIRTHARFLQGPVDRRETIRTRCQANSLRRTSGTRWRRGVLTLTMSMGWMTQVASMPEVPPLAKGFTVFHTPPPAAGTCCCCFVSAISAALGWYRRQREGERWWADWRGLPGNGTNRSIGTLAAVALFAVDGCFFMVRGPTDVGPKWISRPQRRPQRMSRAGRAHENLLFVRSLPSSRACVLVRTREKGWEGGRRR
jgi:hypothetical protein